MHHLRLSSLLKIYLFVLICLLVTLPSQLILLDSLVCLINFRQDYRNHFESWNDNEIRKPWLLLHNINRLPVAQKGDIFPIGAFNVPLVEKFFEEQVRPIFQCFELASESGEITRVKQKIKHILLILEKIYFTIGIDECGTVLFFLGDMLAFDFLMEGLVRALMACHVCGENHTCYPHFDHFKLTWKYVIDKFAFGREQDLH